MAHYSKNDIIGVLNALGVQKGQVIFSHSNIGFFGRPRGEQTAANACSIILEAILHALGPAGTLVVPTFTYSFPAKKVFNPAETPSNCGVFTEFVRKHPLSVRSQDPNISVAAIGGQASTLTQDIPVNAYGSGCFFERFLKADGLICNLNFDAGSTFVHYVERCLRVRYRFDKNFEGIIKKNNKAEVHNSTIWVRQLVEGTTADFEPFDQLARAKGLYTTRQVGRGAIGVIHAQDTFDLIKQTLPERPWFLTTAEKLGILPELSHDPS